MKLADDGPAEHLRLRIVVWFERDACRTGA